MAESQRGVKHLLQELCWEREDHNTMQAGKNRQKIADSVDRNHDQHYPSASTLPNMPSPIHTEYEFGIVFIIRF